MIWNRRTIRVLSDQEILVYPMWGEEPQTFINWVLRWLNTPEHAIAWHGRNGALSSASVTRTAHHSTSLSSPKGNPMDELDEPLMNVQTSKPTDEVPQIIRGLAIRTAEYFRLLCKQDLDPDFAKILTRDWHDAQLAKWVALPYADRYKRPMTVEEKQRTESWRDQINKYPPAPFVSDDGASSL